MSCQYHNCDFEQGGNCLVFQGIIQLNNYRANGFIVEDKQHPLYSLPP